MLNTADPFIQFLLTTNAALLAGIIVTIWRLSLDMATVKADTKNIKRHIFGSDENG